MLNRVRFHNNEDGILWRQTKLMLCGEQCQIEVMHLIIKKKYVTTFIYYTNEQIKNRASVLIHVVRPPLLFQH